MLLYRLMILVGILSQLRPGFTIKPAYCSRKSLGNSGRSNTFLWRIKRRPPSYFFGTIHVPYTDVWEYVNPNAKAAFHKADTVFLELNLNNPKTVQTLLRCQYLPDGEQLVDHLPPALFLRLKRHMQFIRQALPRWISVDQYQSQGNAYAEQLFESIAGNWERKRPIWIMFLLNSLNPQSVENRGIPVLDLYLAQQASVLSKPLGAIETPQEQCQPLNSLRHGQVVYALNQTLGAHERLHLVDPADQVYRQTTMSEVMRRTHDLVQHYICGSLNEAVFTHDSVQLAQQAQALNGNGSVLLAPGQEEQDAINAYFRQELIQKRNNRMAKRVLYLLEKHPNKSFFFAFGAGHFLGKDSVIDLVRESGYDVRPVIARRSNVGRASKVRKNGKSRTRLETIHWRRRQQGASTVVDAALKGHGDALSSTGYPKSRAAATGRASFQELWIRVNGYSPAPWQQIRTSISRAQNLNNYFLLQYPNHFASSSAASAVPVKWPLLWTLSIAVMTAAVALSGLAASSLNHL